MSQNARDLRVMVYLVAGLVTIGLIGSLQMGLPISKGAYLKVGLVTLFIVGLCLVAGRRTRIKARRRNNKAAASRPPTMTAATSDAPYVLMWHKGQPYDFVHQDPVIG